MRPTTLGIRGLKLDSFPLHSTLLYCQFLLLSITG